MNIYAQMAETIIKEQEGIIGPVALEQAKKVPGLEVDWPKHQVYVSGSGKDVINTLIEQYQSLFGQASVEVCREAVKDLTASVAHEELPQLLQ